MKNHELINRYGQRIIKFYSKIGKIPTSEQENMYRTIILKLFDRKHLS